MNSGLCDELCFFIIGEIYRGALNKYKVTTWSLAKKYKWQDFPKDKKDYLRFYTNKTVLIEYRIKQMIKEGLIDMESENGETIYTVRADRALVGKHKFPSGKKDAVLLKMINSKWIIAEA